MSHRVFHLIKSLGRGGVEVFLAEGRAEAGGERFAYGYGYFLPCKDSVVSALKAKGTDVVCFGTKDNVRILFVARRLVKHLWMWGRT